MATVQVVERLIVAQNNPTPPYTVATTTQTPQANDLIVVVFEGSGYTTTGMSGLGATWTHQRQVEVPLHASQITPVEVWLGRGATAAGTITATGTGPRGRTIAYHLRASDGAFISATEMGQGVMGWASLAARERYLRAGDLLIAAHSVQAASGSPLLTTTHAFDAGALSYDDGVFAETSVAHRTAAADETVVVTASATSGTRNGTVLTVALSTDPVERVEAVGFSTQGGRADTDAYPVPFNSVQFRASDIAVVTVQYQHGATEEATVTGLGAAWTRVLRQADVGTAYRTEVWFGTGMTSAGFATATMTGGGGGFNGTIQGIVLRGLPTDNMEAVTAGTTSAATITSPALVGQPGEIMVSLGSFFASSTVNSHFPNPGTPAGWRGGYVYATSSYGHERVAVRVPTVADESHQVTLTSSTSTTRMQIALLRVGIPAPPATALAVTLAATTGLGVTLTTPPPPAMFPYYTVDACDSTTNWYVEQGTSSPITVDNGALLVTQQGAGDVELRRVGAINTTATPVLTVDWKSTQASVTASQIDLLTGAGYRYGLPTGSRQIGGGWTRTWYRISEGYPYSIDGDGLYIEVSGIAVGEEFRIAEVGRTGVRIAATTSLLLREPAALAVTLTATTTLGVALSQPPTPLAVTLAAATALAVAFSRPPAATDTSNRVGGRLREGLAAAVWEPPVVPPPATPAPAPLAYDVAAAFGPVTINGTQPTYEVTTAAVPRARTRVVVGGKDVTYWRGVHTPSPAYQLIAPLLYGPATLVLPQVSATFEEPGVGKLRWLRKGAPVKVQRVDPATNTVVATDYLGVVIAYNTEGRNLSVEVGGQASGRAALRNKQVPIFRAVRDIGRMAHDGVRALGLRFAPRLGPTTGIRLARFGGMSHLDYLNELVAKAWTRDGSQWTVMPDAEGVYRLARKDTTTVHATVYLDDAWAVGNLRRDIAEEPNRIYMTGVDPDGRRLRHAVYPGLNQAPAAPYPFNDGRTFGEGTTNADTHTGDGITVMVKRLLTTKYTNREDMPGGYDRDMVRSVRALQDEAGLPETGDMNVATWEALFDLSATGYSLRHSRIEPMAQRSKVKPWRLSASGAKIARNPNYDATVLPVDRNVDTGAGFTHDQLREWAKAELGPEDNWVGTIALHTGAVVAGQHTPGDPITAADVLPARDLKPGMNVWAPQFMGGVLLHVSAVSVAEDGKVSLAVDARARDTMPVWEVIQRNRESRYHPARAWIDQRRSSTMTKDGLGEWDTAGGKIEDVPCEGGKWTVFPVAAGQAGTIQAIRVRTTPHAEYVVAVFGRYITAEWLKGRVPSPLTKEGGKRWESEAVRARLDARFLLYAAGTNEQPCGYSPGMKTNENGEATGHRLTGRHEDAAGASYYTFGQPVVYVAVWADRDTVVQGGRIMWNQLEAGA